MAVPLRIWGSVLRNTLQYKLHIEAPRWAVADVQLAGGGVAEAWRQVLLHIVRGIFEL